MNQAKGETFIIKTDWAFSTAPEELSFNFGGNIDSSNNFSIGYSRTPGDEIPQQTVRNSCFYEQHIFYI